MEQPKPIDCITSCEALIAAKNAEIARLNKILQDLHENKPGLSRGEHIAKTGMILGKLSQAKSELQTYQEHVAEHQAE